MNIRVNISELDKSVKRQITIIAKRAVDTNGVSRFSDVTPSSAEDDILHDFYADAVTLLNTTSQYFVTGTTTPHEDGNVNGYITLTFPNNHNLAMNTTLTVAFTSFIVAYAIYAWLSIAEPTAVERYQNAMREKLEALIQLIFHKAPPSHEYTYDIPPTINAPGSDITLRDREQIIIGYAPGSDGTDLDITSSEPTIVKVYKNVTTRTFTILNEHPSDNSTTTNATVTISRDNETLLTINVTALPAESDVVAAAPHPILVGLNPIADTITLKQGQTFDIPYTGGTISRIAASTEGIVTFSKTGDTVTITAGSVGTTTLSFYNVAGWSYRLNVVVEAVQGVSPSVSAASNYTLAIGGTRTISYSLGDATTDDLVATITGQSPAGTLTVTKDSTNHTFTITGVLAGSAYVSITSLSHPESNRSIFFVVEAAAVTTGAEVYDYASGSTINIIEGAEAKRIFFYPGDNGTMTITSSSSSIARVVSYNDRHYVDIVPVAAGNATITFSTGTFSHTIYFAVAARPTVVTPPTIYWPNAISIPENTLPGYYPWIDYDLGSDGANRLTITSSDTSVLDVYHNTEAHRFRLTPVSAGEALITISDSQFGVLVQEPVEVTWVAPQLLGGVRDGDTFELTDVYTGTDYEHSLPDIGVNGMQIQFTEASSGTTSVSVIPASRAHIVTSLSTSNGVTVKTLTIFAQQEGNAQIVFENPKGWNARLSLKVNRDYDYQEPIEGSITSYHLVGGSDVTVASGQTSANISTDGTYIYVGVNCGRTSDYLQNASVDIVSSDPSVIEVSQSTIYRAGGVYLIPRSSGTASITFKGRSQTPFFTLNVTATVAEEVVVTPIVQEYRIGNGNAISVEGQNSATINAMVGDPIYFVINDMGLEWDVVSSDTSIATFDFVGGGRGVPPLNVISLLSAGTATVTITTPNNNSWSFVFSITATAAPEINGQTTRILNEGITDTITITNGTAASAVSSNTSVATCSISNGAVIVSAIAEGSTAIYITTNSGRELVVYYSVQPAAQSADPSINGSTSRSLYVGGSDTLNVSRGTIQSVSSSDTSVLTGSVSNGSVSVSAVGAGNATLTIVVTPQGASAGAHTNLTVTYSVLAVNNEPSQSGTIAAYSGQTGHNTGGVYCYLKGFVYLNGNGVTIVNPVVHIVNGNVKACATSDGFLIVYNEDTGQYGTTREEGAWYFNNGASFSGQRQNQICTKAVQLAAAQNTTLVMSDSDSSLNMEMNSSYPAPTLYMQITDN